MLDLRLREEFRGRRLKGTAIELSNDAQTGATQLTARDFLGITYPTHDLVKGIESLGPDQGRPIAVIGERGLGKSHLMATLYHTLNDPTATRDWLSSWATILGRPELREISFRQEMLVIGESLHRQRYKHLWDLLFDLHPHGSYIKGKWEGLGSAKTDIPSDQLILELLRHTPVSLLLDEFQTWYDGLTNTKQYPWKNWAFNFIQILSDIARENPELLVLVVSVRNGDTDAYQQIHRVNPVRIDFKAGGSPDRIQKDRRRMMLHRLFENRLQVPESEIEGLISVHMKEYFRLMNVSSSEFNRKRNDFLDAWPYAPHLLQLLEDQVLVATDAQETRDLIRILANLFKSRGESAPILTAADFRLEDGSAEIGALLDSVANQYHRNLRERALRNITSVTEVIAGSHTLVPNLHEVIAALWLRSIAVGNFAGAEPSALQVDITKRHAIDDNSFQAQLSTIIESSFNIHQIGSRLVFKEEENPQAKVMASARNDRLFADGSDLQQLAKEVRYVLSGSDDVTKTYRVIVLPKSWKYQPWSQLEEHERPERWDDRIPIVVIPEDSDKLQEQLGNWLKDHLTQRRNTVRFLLPRSGTVNIYSERDLLILTRAEMKAYEWRDQGQKYAEIHKKYQTELRGILKKRFDRFAILYRWNFSEPSHCEFHIENLNPQSSQLSDAIESIVGKDLFVPEDFEELVLQAARANSSLGKLLKELQEPRPNGLDCIPWLGEPSMKERLLRLCAKGVIAINLRGMEYLQAQPGEDEDAAWYRLRSKLAINGRQLDEITLHIPTATPMSGGSPLTVQPVSHSNFESLLNGESGTQTQSSLTYTPIGTRVTNESNSRETLGGNIFGQPSRNRKSLKSSATSPLNLIGKLETWGIGAAEQIHDVSIKLNVATGAQLKELLKKLPDGLTFELSLDKEE